MRALLCPIGGRGFVYPMIGIGRTLAARGHQVAFATAPGFAEAIAGAGFERLPRGETDGPSFQLTHWGHPLAVAIQVRHVQDAIERFRPDVLLASTLALGPLIAGEITGLPVAVLGLAGYLWPVPLAGRAVRSGDPLARWRHGEMVEIYNSASGLFGLRPRPRSLEASPLLGGLYLLQAVPGLEPLADHLPPRVRLVGSCVHEPDGPDPELIEWLDAGGDGQPLLYVQHGSIFRSGDGFWPALAAAARELGARVAAATERHRNPPAPFMDQSSLVRGHIAQAAVLEHADALVCSGNTTAVLGALTHGLPALLLPSGGEQPALAARCLEAGAAVVAEPEAPASRLRAALERVLEEASLRRAARRLEADFAAYDGPGRVAAALEELAGAAIVRGVA